jgi:hypothetical protein
MNVKVGTVVGWVLVAFLTLFVLVNWRIEEITVIPFGVFSVRMPLSIALLLAGGLGFVAAVLIRMVKKDRRGS